MNYIEQNRDFKGVWIPKEIWLNDKLTMLEKVILIEIDSLDNEGHCIAGNEYLSQFCQCSIPKVTQAVKKLTELGYIEIVSFDGRHRRIRSCLNSNYEADSGKVLGSIIKSMSLNNKNYEADSGKVLAININNNIDTNIDNINNVDSKESEAEASQDTKDSSKNKSKDKSSSNKRISRKEQLTNYINSLDYTLETKDIIFKWLFSIGLERGVTLNQLTDMLRSHWNACKNEELFREGINNSYLNNWFGFYKPNSNKATVTKTSSYNPTVSEKPKIPHYTAEEW